MGSVRAEILKLKRSASWAVVLALPLMAVATGSANSALSGQGLADGWDTLWLRAVVFYGLFPSSLGIAALASLVWRVEHRGGNWNALMTAGVPGRRVVLGKVAAVVSLSAVMQLVLLLGVVAAGKLVFELPGVLPGRYLLISLVIVVAGVPVAVLQSWLSMVVKSFAAPLAVALLGAVTSAVVLLAAPADLGALLPYGLLSRATQLGTGVFADAGASLTSVSPLLTALALVLSAVLVLVSARALERRDIR
ncbi:ABC transporter permease [Kineococcus sp. SYSU DK001]|uniref:ABC transporter permease n=1 Tax=Kineococcus sp. SYSU DK001 TaxID=3383122 RepID=UPI003D7CBC07